MNNKAIGVIGPGKLGIVLAQLAVKAGYRVVITGSTSDIHLPLTLATLVPGANVLSRTELIKASEIVVLAIPLSKYKMINADELNGKLVIDAMNYWWEVDGDKKNILSPYKSSSEQVQDYFHGARIVKALSHVGYHDLYDHANQTDHGSRRAIAIATNNEHDQKITADFVYRIGFDPIVLGNLSSGSKLEPGRAAFGASLEKNELLAVIEAETSTQ